MSYAENHGFIHNNSNSNIVGSLFGECSSDHLIESDFSALNLVSQTDEQCFGQLDRALTTIFPYYYTGFENHFFSEQGYCVCCGTICNHEWSSEFLDSNYYSKEQYHLCMHCLNQQMHDWNGNGICSSCGYECQHAYRTDFWQDGVCMKCGAQCQHVFNGTTGGQCMNCNYICPHMNTTETEYGGMYCMDCGMELN